MDETPILHMDADAFFPSVEQVLEPKYRGKPLIVGGGHRGVVASCSYEARRFGVHSAMPIYKARQRCPQGIFIKGNHKMYAHFSERMFEIFRRFTPTVEITSIDEGYLDLSGTRTLHKASYFEIAGRILTTVREELGITVSGGLSTNKMVSKVASSLNKPRRLTWIWAGREKEFLRPLSLQSLPGIGPKTLPKLERLGLRTLGDLADIPFESAWDMMGGHGIHLWERANGIDRRPVEPESFRRKSISEEKTFPIDLDSQELLMKEADAMLRSLCRALRQDGLYATTVTLKVRYGDFQTFTHQRTLDQASNLQNEFSGVLRQLFKKRDPKRKVRLIGVGLSHLQNEVQLQLFGPAGAAVTQASERRLALEAELDVLRDKYGEGII